MNEIKEKQDHCTNNIIIFKRLFFFFFFKKIRKGLQGRIFTTSDPKGRRSGRS
jgi:hypothetical protein